MWHLLLGPQQQKTLTHRLMLSFNLLAILIFVIGVLVNLFLGLGLKLILVAGFFSCVFIGMFMWTRRSETIDPVRWPFLILGLLSFIPFWLLSEASHGSTVFFYAVMAPIGVLIAGERYFARWLLLLLFHVSLLFLLEWVLPSWISAYESNLARWTDMYISALCAVLYVCWVVHFFQISYEEEKQKAQASERMKSLFLTNMSHELRTPLNAIIGFTHILQKKNGIEDDKQAQYLERIDFNANHLLEIINDLLDLSKIEADKMDLNIEEFDLKQMLLQLTAQFEALCLKKGIPMHVEFPPLLRPLVTDSLRFSQVIYNLLANAIKFTDAGYIRIRVASTAGGEPDFIEIEDTGIGMTEDQLSRIFEPFRQAEEGNSRKYGGTGLGLAICKMLCEQMGYQLSVKSHWGQGSTFRIVLGYTGSA